MRANVIAFRPGCTFTGTCRARAPGRLPPGQGPGGRCRLVLRPRPGGTTVLTPLKRVITTAIRAHTVSQVPIAAMQEGPLHWSMRTPASRGGGRPQ
jgi:hypothetical protein